MVIKSRKKGGRGHAISKVKRQNQRRTKLVKQGKLKLKRNKRATDIRRNPNKHLPLRLKLLCVKTLLSVLSGHGQFLTIDPARFHAQLYRCLLPICT
ncbi:hypothetical protein B566_EDAN018992, partial [Ephemera danica]